MIKQLFLAAIIGISFIHCEGMQMPLALYDPTPQKIESLKSDLMVLQNKPKKKELKSDDFYYILRVQNEKTKYYHIKNKNDMKYALKKTKKKERTWYKLSTTNYFIVLSKIVCK